MLVLIRNEDPQTGVTRSLDIHGLSHIPGKEVIVLQGSDSSREDSYHVVRFENFPLSFVNAARAILEKVHWENEKVPFTSRRGALCGNFERKDGGIVLSYTLNIKPGAYINRTPSGTYEIVLTPGELESIIQGFENYLTY